MRNIIFACLVVMAGCAVLQQHPQVPEQWTCNICDTENSAMSYCRECRIEYYNSNLATPEKIAKAEKETLEKSGIIPDDFEYPVIGMFDPPPSWILRGSFATTKYFFVVGRGEGAERGGDACLDAFQDATQGYERCNLQKAPEQLEVRCYWEEILVMKSRKPTYLYRVAILYRFPLAKGEVK